MTTIADQPVAPVSSIGLTLNGGLERPVVAADQEHRKG